MKNIEAQNVSHQTNVVVLFYQNFKQYFTNLNILKFLIIFVRISNTIQLLFTSCIYLI